MIAKNIIDPLLIPLKPTDTVAFAVEALLVSNISALPVVANNEVIGFIEEATLLNNTIKETIETYITQHPSWIVFENYHHHEAMRLFTQGKAQCLAIINEDAQFSGMASKDSLLDFISKSYTMGAEGSIIEIEIAARDYSLSELNSIIEAEDSKILGLTFYSIPESSRVILCLKLNTIYIDRIVLSLKRFGYDVTQTFYNAHDIFDVENRYKSFLKYLET